MTSRSVLPGERAPSPPRVAAVFVCLLSVFLCARASAQTSHSVDLQWDAPAECPRVEEVQARLRKLAGPLKSPPHALRAEATVTRTGDDQLHLRLVVRSGNQVGERNIDGKSCDGLAGATAVALVLLLRSSEPLGKDALALNTSSGAAEANGGDTKTASASPPRAAQATPPAAPPTPAAEAERQHTASAVSDAAARPERRWHVLLEFPQLALGVGPLRQPSVGGALAAGVSFEAWRFLARGSVWLPQHASTTSDGQQYGGDIDRTTASLLACRALLTSRLEIAPCVSLSVEHVSARGTGAHVAPHTDTATWAAVGVGALARFYVVPWLSLIVAIDAQVETSRPVLSLTDLGPVEQLLPAAATGTLGSEWIF